LIKANDMELIDNKISLKFLTEQCQHGCANCKYSHVSKLKEADTKIIYIGDGLSDIFPSRELADIIFAKEGEDLATTLSNDERLIKFQDFNQIRDKIQEIIEK
jgi:2-hydroxy-3-keto-5-methylthiopentenyl-1-phosphate phosphatase